MLGFFLLVGTSARATIGFAHQMLLGNPSNAGSNATNRQHYLIQRDVAALDYNDTRRQPNWASWHLTTADVGSSGRSSFSADASLPSGFYQVQTTDYSGSGYDRGHLCPSGDRTVSVAINEETFLMSNMMPQSPDNNQGVWANLENYCRTLAAGGNEVLITCGPEGFGDRRTASSGQIPIASNVWKIVVVVPLGSGATVDRISPATRVIAVNIPNIQGVRTDPWQNYLTSVNQLQTNTGFTFFTALNTNLAAVLRAKVDGSLAVGITNVTPGSGIADSPVVLRGTNFTGTTTVRFNGHHATFTLNSPHQITALVPGGATTGPISVLAAGGLATSPSSFSVNASVAAQPKLSIALVGASVVLSWPSDAAGYELQHNPDLNPNHWTEYLGPVTVIGPNHTATFPVPSGPFFFRLRAPSP